MVCSHGFNSIKRTCSPPCNQARIAHLHILVNRVDTEYNLFSDSFIGKSASATADKIASRLYLVRTKDVETTRKDANRAVRQEIFKKFQIVRKEGFRDFSEFSVKMKSVGITVNPTYKQQRRDTGLQGGLQRT